VLLLIYVVVQLILVLMSRNKKRSFHMFFLILSFLWTGFRVAGTTRILIPGADPPFINALVWQTENWLSIQTQWAMFTFLLMYYFRLLSGDNWSDRRRFIVKVYVVANCVGLFIVLALSATNAYGASRSMSTVVIHAHNETQHVTSLCSSVFNAYSSTMFVSLCVGMIVFSVRLCLRERVRNHHLLNVKRTVAVNIILSLIFMSRAVFDMYNALIKYFTVKHLEIDYPDNGFEKDFMFYVWLLLVVWEILPMVLLLVTLAKNKAVEKRLFSRGHLKPGYGVFQRLERQPGESSPRSNALSVDSMDALMEEYNHSSASDSD